MPTDHPIGVCSWCLGTDDVPEMFRRAREQLHVDVVQLGMFGAAAVEAADPALIRSAAAEFDIALSASFVLFDHEDYASIDAIRRTGGFAPADPFTQRLALLQRVARITQTLGLTRLSVHGGAIPESPDDPRYAAMVERFRTAADSLATRNVRLLLETGQESAATLRRLIEDVDRPTVGVNFDSGNYIMYGTDDPANAAALLTPHIEHVHLKDACRSASPGTAWGSEVTLGAGDARIVDVLQTLQQSDYTGPLVVERSRRRSITELADSLNFLRQSLEHS